MCDGIRAEMLLSALHSNAPRLLSPTRKRAPHILISHAMAGDGRLSSQATDYSLPRSESSRKHFRTVSEWTMHSCLWAAPR